MTRNWRLHYIQSLTLHNKDSIKFQVTWLVQLITWSLTSCFWQKEWIFDPVLFRLRIYFYQGGITTIAISLQLRILAMLKVKMWTAISHNNFLYHKTQFIRSLWRVVVQVNLICNSWGKLHPKIRKYNCNSTINFF